jgi:NADP-dependent 3-hydroxy acid dehydrogenase YdfG
MTPRNAAGNPPRAPLAQQTLVITGASSGIGLAVAEQAAAAGAQLVIAARDRIALEDIATRLEQSGARAVLPVACDVGQADQVKELARAAIERFGGFDTWINNAGVGLIGSVLDDYDEAQARRLMDTNYWGMVHGSLAAVAHLRGKPGTLINVASITADHAVPLQTVYSASKHAVKGFSEGLRQELLAENSPMAVVVVKPACIATPLIEHVAHPAGRKPRLVSPLYDPADAAQAILEAAVYPQRVVEVGGVAALNAVSSALAPGVMDATAPVIAERQWRDEPSAGSAGNLFEPSRDSHGRTTGHHPGQTIQRSYYNRAVQPLGGMAGMVAGTLAAGGWMLAQAMSKKRRGMP